MTTSLASALRLYFGRGTAAYPKANPESVLAVFGAGLLERVEALVAECAGLSPDWSEHSLASAAEWVESQMKRHHPELDDEGAEVLGWAFSFWNR